MGVDRLGADRSMPARIAAGLGVLVLCCLPGACGGPREAPPLPAVYRTADFPDLPFPPGYAPVAGSGHLAIALGGGALRRLQTTLELPKTARGPEDEEELLGWYQERLPRLGWHLTTIPGSTGSQTWRREYADGRRERLLLETGRAHARPIIRLTLGPEG